MTTEVLEETLYGIAPMNDVDANTKALNRLAQAVEHLTLTLIDQRAPQTVRPPQAPLAALPPLQPVQVVANAPTCPKHGPDRVKASTKFAGFYCTAKDEQGPRGYCGWQHRG